MSEAATETSGARRAAGLKPLQVRNLTPRVGAEVSGDRAAIIRGDYREEIRDLLEQRGVIVMRDMHLTEDEQRTFSNTMGEVLIQGQKRQDVMSVTLDESLHPRAYDYLYATINWHFDGSNEEYPNRGAVLTPVKLSDEGGNTEFANTYTAYDDLTEAEKQAFAKLRVRHSNEALHRSAHKNPTEDQIKLWRETLTRVHPLVWTHRSGRKSLVLGHSSEAVVGMDEAESRALLDRLLDQATQPHNVYVHEWRMGDVLIWDNTGVVHRVQPYDRDSGRHLRRCSLAGEEPFA
jgi:alpha-ketoglutarate-dependent taurine dioxygenase